jgi:hypothetical protein
MEDVAANGVIENGWIKDDEIRLGRRVALGDFKGSCEVKIDGRGHRGGCKYSRQESIEAEMRDIPVTKTSDVEATSDVLGVRGTRGFEPDGAATRRRDRLAFAAAATRLSMRW